jgi:hypothetical protein
MHKIQVEHFEQENDIAEQAAVCSQMERARSNVAHPTDTVALGSRGSWDIHEQEGTFRSAVEADGMQESAEYLAEHAEGLQKPAESLGERVEELREPAEDLWDPAGGSWDPAELSSDVWDDARDEDIVAGSLDEDKVESGAAEEVPSAANGHRPREDAFGNTFIRVVHSNGIHYLPLFFCLCGQMDRFHLDLMHAHLFPTSFSRIRTVFTVAGLNDYRLSNLELKASAYQYWQKLTRLSSHGGTTEVIDLYRELRRLSRQWRHLKKMKWAGFGHEAKDADQPAPGELAIFCPTCPQPGINLPPDWQADPNR